jgi:hypothetical protein
MSGLTLEMLDDAVRRAREAPRPEWYIAIPSGFYSLIYDEARPQYSRAYDGGAPVGWMPEAMVIAREVVTE